MNKIEKYPSPEEVKALENKALRKADIFIEMYKKKGRGSPKRNFLRSIEKVLMKLLDEKVPYRKISTFIFKVYNFKVSEQLIMDYAKNVLHYNSDRSRKGLDSTIEKLEKNKKNESTIHIDSTVLGETYE